MNNIIAALKFASSFASKKDDRAFCAYVYTVEEDNKTVLYATNGFTAVKITLPEILSLPKTITLDSIDNAYKTKLESLLVGSEDEVRLPPIDKVFNDEIHQGPVGFNCEYLAKIMAALTKLFKDCGRKGFAVKVINHTPDKANIFETCVGDIFIKIALMPCKI